MPRFHITIPVKMSLRIKALADELGLDGLSSTICFVVADWLRHEDSRGLSGAESAQSGPPVAESGPKRPLPVESILSSLSNSINKDNIFFEEGGSGGKELSCGPKVAQNGHKTATVEKIKAKPAFDQVFARLPEECRGDYEIFETMVANKNASREVSKSRMAGLLADILERTKDLPPAALSHGFLAAVAAKGGGADNAIYVSKAAHGYQPREYIGKEYQHNGHPEIPEETFECVQ
jgi:hypothetical protein